MTLEHRMPTLEEVDSLEVVTITGDSSWNPRDHNTYPGIKITSMSNPMVTIEQPSMALNSIQEDEWEDHQQDDISVTSEDSDGNFLDAMQDAPEDEFFYFDASPCVRTVFGNAIHLDFDGDFIRSTDLDSFLISLPDDELLGHNEEFDCVQHAVNASVLHTSNCHASNPVRTVPNKLTEDEYEHIRRCLAFLPLGASRRL